MTNYKCFQCQKDINEEHIRSRVRCIYCGSRVLYKERSVTTKIKAI